MKKLFLLLMFIPLVSFGQKSNDADALKLCVALQSNNFTTDAEAEDAVNKILSVIGASQKPVLQACSNINNAVAAVYKGQRYILYDREFMNSLTAGSNQYWSNMFILAHEVGHHINGHSLDIILYANDVIDPKSLEEKRAQELEADEFAGFVLAKLGASLSQTSKVLSNLPRITNENSSTHPSKDKRIASVKVGYKKGGVKIDEIQKSTKSDLNKRVNNDVESETIYQWSSVNYYPLDNYISKLEELEKRKFDPFERKKWEKNTPIHMKRSYVTGKSFRKAGKMETVELIIEQRRYKNIGGVVNSIYPNGVKNDLERRYFPYTEISIKLKNFKEMPKISRYYPNSEYKKIDGEFIVKFEYIINDNIQGFFIARLDGYNLDLTADFKKDENGDYIKDENGIFIRAYENYITSDISFTPILFSENEDDILNLVKFMKGLKEGNKLYLKMGDSKINYQQIIDSKNRESLQWIYDGSLNRHTYVFDLKGSSKALQF
ncbi:M48 family metalloprotease [Flavobacteriaceae bacterium]|nr:M48 family metalloprotease [Flavobacteriaceae bacterium]